MEGRDRRKEERRRDRRTKVKFENVRTCDAVSAPSSAGRVCRRTHSRPRGRSRTGGNCGGRVRDSQSIPLSSPRLHPPRPTHSPLKPTSVPAPPPFHPSAPLSPKPPPPPFHATTTTHCPSPSGKACANGTHVGPANLPAPRPYITTAAHATSEALKFVMAGSSGGSAIAMACGIRAIMPTYTRHYSCASTDFCCLSH